MKKDYLVYSKDSAQTSFKIPETSKVDNLVNEGKFDEALTLINKLIENDSNDYENWYYKGIILDNLAEYEKAVESFKKALVLNDGDEIKTFIANSLYKWAKIAFFPDLEYQKALTLINEALEIIPESEDSSEFYFLKGEILEALKEPVEARKNYLIAYGEFDKLREFEAQVDYLNNNEDVLINITGSYFYNFTPSAGQIVDLVKESENEYDSDAIAIYLDNKKVGYVANSEYTLMDGIKSASKINGLISDDAQAEILFVYLDEYIIAKLIYKNSGPGGI